MFDFYYILLCFAITFNNIFNSIWHYYNYISFCLFCCLLDIYIKNLDQQVSNTNFLLLCIAIQKERLAVDQSFNKGMEKYTKLEQAHLHTKVDTIKERASLNEDSLMHKKDQGRKNELQKYACIRSLMPWGVQKLIWNVVI